METQRAPSQPETVSGSLEIRLLGEIRVLRDGEAIALPASKRTRALLGYLAANGGEHPRQLLCDLLWDGPDDPRAALRWSLSKLRPFVNEAAVERLVADREHVAFSLLGTATDLGQIERLVRADPAAADITEIESAAALMRGEFLDGLDLPSCYRFHHWCLAERERWGALRRRVLLEAVSRLGGEPGKALPYARALVAVDPLSEAAHGKLVALLAALGRRKDAQDHYATAKAMLQRELGVPLGGELKPPPMVRRLLEAEPPASRAESVPEARNARLAVVEPDIIGRVAECEAIGEEFAALTAGAVRPGLLFLGEPGIGKSRLLSFAAQRAQPLGLQVIAARCFEAEAVRPFGCWADLLGPYVGAATDPSVRRALALFQPSSDLSSKDEGSRTQLFGAVVSLLIAVAAKSPVVLMIDDLQWIDEASASLLHFVLRAESLPARLLFVGAARADEIDDNPWCKRTFSALAQVGAIKRLRLEGLTDDEAAAFFAPDTGSAEIAAALRQCGGNPLFLAQLAGAGQLGGKATVRDLDSLIADRIDRLDPPERDLIVFASATARDFQPERLGMAMDLPEVQLLARIDRLERHGLLKSSGEGRFDFAHDLIRQTTYRSLSQPRRRLIHRQIARAFKQALSEDRAVAGELAYHAGAAGDHALAVEASIAAGEHCLRMFANTAAIDAAERGLAHLEQLPAGPDRARWHIALLKVKVFAGASPRYRADPKLSEEVQRALESAELLGVRDDNAVFGWHMASWAAHHSNDAVAAAGAILRAEELTRPLDAAARCRQLASTGRCLLDVESEIPRARAFLRQAEEIATSLGQQIVELDWGRGLIARWDGDLEASEHAMRRALTLARLQEDRWREIECIVWLAKIALEGGAVSKVEAYCVEIDTISARIGDGPAPIARALRTIIALPARGEAAEQHIAATLAELRALDDKALLAYVLNHFAAWRLRHGDAAGAKQDASEALAAAEAVKRETETIVAKALLALSEARVGDRGKVDLDDDLLSAARNPTIMSARAREFLYLASGRQVIPTLAQTIRS